MKQDTRVEIDSRGRERTLVRTSCPCCRGCWMYEDNGKCVHGGPFSGYVEILDGSWIEAQEKLK